MAQPTWKFVANLGDTNPLEHGGLFVFIDETGVYPPEMAKVEPTGDDEDDDDKYVIHRAVLERCTYVNNVLSDNEFHPNNPAWFADKLPDVANFIGVEVAEMIDWLTGTSPTDLARAYEAIGSYHGWANLDNYPLTLSRKEVKEKYETALAR